MQRGDVLSLQLSGAGGFGPPGSRTAEDVEQDRMDGYVSDAAAAKLYGR